MPTTPKRPHEQVNESREIKTFKDRDYFCRAVLADVELSLTERALTVRLALHQDIEGRHCILDYKTLGKDVGVSERTAIRAVAAAEARGWLAIQRTPGKCNNFRLLLPAPGVTDRCHPPGVTKRARGVTKMARGGDNSRQGGVTPRCHPLSEESKKLPKKEEYISTPPRDADDSNGDADLFGEPTTNNGESTNSPPASDTVAPHDGDSPFDQFWQVYPRRVAMEAARVAWAKAVKRGVDPAVMIAGAKRYAAERAGQDPTFTKHPKGWLAGGCWDDEPLPSAVIDQLGNVVAMRRLKQRESWSEWAERRQAKREAGLL